MPVVTNSTPVAGSPLINPGPRAKIDQKKQFIIEVFKRSDKLPEVSAQNLKWLASENINSLYDLCTRSMDNGQQVDEHMLAILEQKILDIETASKAITQIRHGNPYLKPFQEFFTAARKYDKDDDAAVRVGVVLEAVGALVEGIGKMAKKTGQFLQEHPKALAAIISVLGVSIPVLWPASASVVTAIAIGIAVLEIGVYGYKKWKSYKAKRQLIADQALQDIEAVPELAQGVRAQIAQEVQQEIAAHTQAAPVTETASPAAQEVAFIMSRSGSNLKALEIDAAIGTDAAKRIKLDDIRITDGEHTPKQKNVDALNALIANHKSMPKNAAEADLKTQKIIAKISAQYKEIEGKEMSDDLKAALAEKLTPKLKEALTPSATPTALEHIGQLTKTIEALGNTTEITSDSNLKQAIRAVQKDVGQPLAKMKQAKIIKDISREAAVKIDGAARTVERERTNTRNR